MERRRNGRRQGPRPDTPRADDPGGSDAESRLSKPRRRGQLPHAPPNGQTAHDQVGPAAATRLHPAVPARLVDGHAGGGSAPVGAPMDGTVVAEGCERPPRLYVGPFTGSTP